MYVGISRYTALATLGACVALYGCKAKDNSATDTSAMSASTTTAGSASTSAAATATTTDTVMTDANIAALVDEANTGDSTLAAAALPHLRSSGAKDFAKSMMGEHHALHVQGLEVEKAQNITPQLPATDPFKPAVEAEQSALASISKGPAYDSTYISQEVGIHQAVIGWLGSHPPTNAAYQKYLKMAGPVLQKHLDRALALQKKMSGTKA